MTQQETACNFNEEQQELLAQTNRIVRMNEGRELPFTGIQLLQMLYGKDLECFLRKLPSNILHNAEPFLIDYKTSAIDLGQILSKSMQDLKFLLKRGFPFKKVKFIIHDTSTITPDKQKWIFKHVHKVIFTRLTISQLEEYQNEGLMPCFPAIPKTLSYIWLVDRNITSVYSKDLLDERNPRSEAYLENIKHNMKVLNGYKQILWTNCKQCIPITVNKLAQLEFEIKELNQLPNLDNPVISQIASVISTKYKKEVAPTFIDTWKLLVTGFAADLNYKFNRKPTERKPAKTIPPTCTNDTDPYMHCDTEQDSVQNSTIGELDSGLIFSIHGNKADSVDIIDTHMLASCENHPFILSFINYLYKKIYEKENFDLILNNYFINYELFAIASPHVGLHLGYDNVLSDKHTYFSDEL